MNIIYCVANRDDFRTLAKLRWEFKEENRNYDDAFLAKYIEYLEQETMLERLRVFIARVKGVIVGNVNLIIIPKSPKPSALINKIGYITNVYVQSEFRNKGIGAEILRIVIEYAKKTRIEVLIVWPSERSRSFYKCFRFDSDNEILENIVLPDEDNK